MLRQSRREGQKIIKTTILNITNWGGQNCEAFAAFLKNKKLLSQVAENILEPAPPKPSSDLSPSKLPEIVGKFLLA